MAVDDQKSGSTATMNRPAPARPRVDRLPPFNVLLHNDDVNDMTFIVETIVRLVSLDPRVAMLRMLEAHTKGLSLLTTTHREHAELLCEQFASRKVTVTIEPAV